MVGIDEYLFGCGELVAFPAWIAVRSNSDLSCRWLPAAKGDTARSGAVMGLNFVF